LPLLAFTLETLYRRCAAKGKIELADYDAIGGVEGAIRQAAEGILPSNAPADLPPDVIAAVRLCFNKHLVQINDKGEFVRRVAPWREVIADIPAAVADPTSRILEKFVQARLLTKTISAGGGPHPKDTPDVTLEVTHEAIFRCWPPLQLWLNESARVLRWRRDVRRDRESAALNKQRWAGLKSEQLAISRDWPTTRRAELSTEEALWIEQAARRANRIKIAVAFIMLLLALLGTLAAWNAHQATQEFEAARSQSLNTALTLVDTLLKENRPQDALAHLANVCRRYPDQSLAATRLFSLLSNRAWALPITRPIYLPDKNYRDGNPIERARFSPDGLYIVIGRYIEGGAKQKFGMSRSKS
jgi:hypothetical protein